MNTFHDVCLMRGSRRSSGIQEIVKALELIDSRLDVHLTVTGKFHDPAFQREDEKQKARDRIRFPGFEDMPVEGRHSAGQPVRDQE